MMLPRSVSVVKIVARIRRVTVVGHAYERFLVENFPSFGQIIEPRGNLRLLEGFGVLVWVLFLGYGETRYAEVWEVLAILG